MVNNFSKLFLAAEILGQAVGTAADLMTLHQYGFADIRVYQKNPFPDTSQRRSYGYCSSAFSFSRYGTCKENGF